MSEPQCACHGIFLAVDRQRGDAYPRRDRVVSDFHRVEDVEPVDAAERHPAVREHGRIPDLERVALQAVASRESLDPQGLGREADQAVSSHPEVPLRVLEDGLELIVGKTRTCLPVIDSELQAVGGRV